MAKNYSYTQQRFNGTDWDTLYPETLATQVKQTNAKVFWNPSTTINGETFGKIENGTWTPNNITLDATEIYMDSTGKESISEAIAKLGGGLDGTIKGSVQLDEIVIGSGIQSVKSSGKHIITAVPTGSASLWESGVPTGSCVTDWGTNIYTGSKNITTLGTIGQGVWNGTIISLDRGGTGAGTAEGARTNLGLKTAATKEVDNSVSSTSENLPTSKAVQTAIDAAIGKVNQFTIIKSTTAGDTPDVASWTTSTGTTIKGELIPSKAEKHAIYFVPSANGTSDVFDEYMSINNVWEKLGNTDIDLTGYVKGTSLNENYLLLGNNGSNIKTSTAKIASGYSAGDNGNLITVGIASDLVTSRLNAYAGTNKITTVGTITSGTWQGTAIANNYIADLPTSKITALTDYTIATTISDLSKTDSLNTALGKLEKRIKTNTTNIAAVNTRNATKIFFETKTEGLTGMQTGDICLVYKEVTL